MQKFLAPAALALAMMVSGAAFAADQSLYNETSPFAAAAAASHAEMQHWASVDSSTQRASTAPMPHNGWEKPADTREFQMHDPE